MADCTRRPPCGHQHPKCTAHKASAPDTPCGATPVAGLAVCRAHGGAAPGAAARAAAHRAGALADKRMARAVVTLGLRRDITPADALLEEVQWAAGHVAWLREQVQRLEADALVYGVTSEVDRRATEFPGTDTTRAAATNIWLDLYDRERRHLVQVCKAAIDAGIAERQVRLAERLGETIVSVLRAAVAHLPAAEQETCLRVASERIRTLGAA